VVVSKVCLAVRSVKRRKKTNREVLMFATGRQDVSVVLGLVAVIALLAANRGAGHSADRDVLGSEERDPSMPPPLTTDFGSAHHPSKTLVSNAEFQV
jgi:hypothetical protein